MVPLQRKSNLRFATWRNILRQMATARARQSAERDFSLVFLAADTPEPEVRSAFRKKRDWVVTVHPSPVPRYKAVIFNLQGSYVASDKTTIDYIRNVISHGFPRDAFDRLKDVIAISGDTLSQVVRIPTRTIARRELFKPEESERIFRVASAFQRAIEVLGSLDKARKWFSSPKRALGNKRPIEFCDTEPGADEVIHLLGRIEHGVFT